MTIKSAPHFACDLQDHLINAAFADNVLDVDAVGDMLTDEIAELAEDFLGDLAPVIFGKVLRNDTHAEIGHNRQHVQAGAAVFAKIDDARGLEVSPCGLRQDQLIQGQVRNSSS